MGLYGIHASIGGGVFNAISEGEALGCEAIQIFTANQRMWSVKTPPETDVASFKSGWKKSGIKKIVSHGSYLVNLAGANKELLEKSRAAFFGEMQRAHALGLDSIVFHPGSFTGGTFEQGVKNIVDSVNEALKKFKDFRPKLLLETTAGSGNSIGGKFEDLALIIGKVKRKEKMGVCFDTAHVFEAGYDVKGGYEAVFKEFDKVIGLERLNCFHINDSKTPFASHADRHEHIGKGLIGTEFFGKLTRDKRFKETPMIIETPAENGMDKKNLDILRKLGRKS